MNRMHILGRRDVASPILRLMMVCLALAFILFPDSAGADIMVTVSGPAGQASQSLPDDVVQRLLG